MLIKRKSGEAEPQPAAGPRRRPRLRARSIAAPSCSAPASRSAASRPSARSSSAPCARPRPQRRCPARRSRSRRTSAPIARSAAPSRPRCRTGSGSARSRPGRARSTAARTAPRAPRCASSCTGTRRLKYPMKLVGGAVAAHLLGPGDQRDRRQADRHPREVRRRFRVLARLGQVHQRGRLPVPQVRRLLGHQLRRPPGPHLPLDHGGGRRQHLGLRRADQLLQRPAQLQDHAHPRRQPGRGAPDLRPAPARRQGDQPRQPHRHRPALHPHGRARHRVRAAPPRHRHPGPDGA